MASYDNKYANDISGTNGANKKLITAGFSSRAQSLEDELSSAADILTHEYVVARGLGGAGDYSPLDILVGSDKTWAVVGGNDNELFIGSKGSDRFYGGDGDDLLLGEGGSDYLEGGAGYDTYAFSGEWGQDTVVDGDGVGCLVIEGQTLEGGQFQKIADNWWRNADLGLTCVLINTGQGQNLLLSKDGNNSSITVQNWQDGQLGITLPDGAEPPQVVDTMTGEQRAPLDGIEINQGSVLPGNPLYNTYLWSAVSWNADGTLAGGVAQAGYNDVIYGTGGNDKIQSSGNANKALPPAGSQGNDALDGRGGDDVIDGGDGDDLIAGGAGSDTIHGGAGNDVILSATGLNVPQRIGPDESWSAPPGQTAWIAGSNWGVSLDGNGHYTIYGGGSIDMDSAGDWVWSEVGDDIIAIDTIALRQGSTWVECQFGL
jgi:Ca2+-binding RTX toxin-like protein